MRVKGRYLVLGWTAVFLGAAGIIALRTASGFRTGHRIDQLDRAINVLESRRSDLQAQVAFLQNRENLGPKVRAMGLRPVSDSDLVTLSLPTRP